MGDFILRQCLPISLFTSGWTRQQNLDKPGNWERWALDGMPIPVSNNFLVGSTELALAKANEFWTVHNQTLLLTVKILTDSTIADFFDSDCWRIFRGVNLQYKSVYAKILKGNFVDAMQIVRQIKDWQVTHGRTWPNAEDLRPVSFREEVWDLREDHSQAKALADSSESVLE
jgi:hypothetical protein